MTAKLDRKSLARWRKHPTDFIEEVLIDPETNKPFVLLPAERVFLQHAFRLDPSGRLAYPELVFAAPKKSGKTGFAALFTITMTVLFGGRYGEAVCCANDFEQSVGRVFQAVKRIVECSPLLRADAKVLSDRVTIGDATITAIASDAAGAAGGNQCIAVFDELWGYTSEKAHRLFDELVPPPTRKIAARLTGTYAGFEGESMLLEELYRRGMAQSEIAPNLRAGDGILMAWHHDPIAPWQTEAWLDEMRRSLRPQQFLRMIENRFVTSESPFVEMAAWDACVEPGLSRVVSDQRLPVLVGVDVSVKHDSTAIVAVTWEKAQRVRLVAHRVFQPSPGDPIDFEAVVEATVREFATRFRVLRVLVDPWQMLSVVQRLTRAGLPVEEFPQTSAKLTAAAQNLFELVMGRNLALYPDESMRVAIGRTVALETARGWKIDKAKQRHKVDVIIALAMASLGAVEAQTSAPPLWTPDALLINGKPAGMPYKFAFVFGVMILGAREAAVVHFGLVFAAHLDKMLYVVDATAAPLSPMLIDGAVARFDDFMSLSGCWMFASASLVPEFRRRGFLCVSPIDDLVREGTEALAVSATRHIGTDKVKLTPPALVERNPLDGVPSGKDDDALYLCALVGIALGLDEVRKLKRKQGRAA